MITRLKLIYRGLTKEQEVIDENVQDVREVKQYEPMYPWHLGTIADALE